MTKYPKIHFDSIQGSTLSEEEGGEGEKNLFHVSISTMNITVQYRLCPING